MSLEYAILGFISQAPLSGYDLKKVFDVSVRHFWPADQSQIYRTLNRLSKKGWAKVEVIEQDNRPDRKVYHITDPGKKELIRWLMTPQILEVARSAPLIQVFFSSHLEDEYTIQYFQATAAMIRQVLTVYSSIPDTLINEVMREVPAINSISDRERFFWLLTLESGITNMRSSLEWMESVIERLKKKDYTNRLMLEER